MHEIKDKILNARNILAVLPKNPKPNLLAAVLSFVLTIEDIGKNIRFICDENNKIFNIIKKPKELSEDIKESGDILISIDTKNKQLKELKYEKLDDRIHIYIDAGKEGLRKNAISAKFAKSPYDLILAFGARGKEQLGDFYLKNTDIFDGAHIEYINSDSYFKIIFNFLTSVKTKHTKEVATGLLASVIEETSNFQKTKEPNLFKAASFLMEAGADHQAVVKQLRENIKAEDLKHIGLVLKNSSYLANSVISKISALEIKERDFNIKKIANISQKIKSFISEKDNLIILAETFFKQEKQTIIIGVFTSLKKENMASFAKIVNNSKYEDYILFTINAVSPDEAEKKIATLLNYSF